MRTTCIVNFFLLDLIILRIFKNILSLLIRSRWEVVDWIHLAQDRDQWWAVVITFGFLKDGEFLD
jgi:hypothetical protein